MNLCDDAGIRLSVVGFSAGLSSTRPGCSLRRRSCHRRQSRYTPCPGPRGFPVFVSAASSVDWVRSAACSIPTESRRRSWRLARSRRGRADPPRVNKLPLPPRISPAFDHWPPCPGLVSWAHPTRWRRVGSHPRAFVVGFSPRTRQAKNRDSLLFALVSATPCSAEVLGVPQRPGDTEPRRGLIRERRSKPRFS